MALARTAVVASLFVALATLGSADNGFLRASRVTLKDVEDELRAELSDSSRQREHKDRVKALEADLRPMYTALPKSANGHVPHAVVRYVLHRVFAKDHGWFIKGLEPDGTGLNGGSTSLTSLKEWVPSHLQDMLEKGSNGMGLHELAVLAVTLEDLVHKEAIGRLEALYNLHGYSLTEPVKLELADKLLDSFSLIYSKGGNWTAQTSQEAWQRTENFKRNSQQWSRLEPFLRKVRADVTQQSSPDAMLDFAAVAKVAEAVGARYGEDYFQQDCKSVKAELLAMEDQMPGRVLLSSFYGKATHRRWAFTEKVDYLRVLGALDESDKSKPRVIVSNYVGSRPNCLEASGFYAICCPNECEGLMDHLETSIKQSASDPQTVSKLVAALPSATVQAPRELPASLLARLDQIASTHGGRVPLHGRLFAQWMHHAFPRECPFPHEAGTTFPQTADEWIAQTGQESTQASEEEMTCHVSGPCAGGASAAVVQAPTQSTFATAKADAAAAAADAGISIPGEAASGAETAAEGAESASTVALVELPWSDAEELLVDSNDVLELGAWAGTDEDHLARTKAFNRLLRTLIFYGVALGLAFWAKAPQLDFADPKKSLCDIPAATLALFLVPLGVICLDCLAGFAPDLFTGQELLLCGCCWGLAAIFASPEPSDMKQKGSRTDTPYPVDTFGISYF